MQEPEICLESYSFKQLFRLLWALQNHQYICKFQLIPGLNSCARILVILKTQSNQKLACKFSTLVDYHWLVKQSYFISSPSDAEGPWQEANSQRFLFFLCWKFLGQFRIQLRLEGHCCQEEKSFHVLPHRKFWIQQQQLWTWKGKVLRKRQVAAWAKG